MNSENVYNCQEIHTDRAAIGNARSLSGGNVCIVWIESALGTTHTSSTGEVINNLFHCTSVLVKKKLMRYTNDNHV